MDNFKFLGEVNVRGWFKIINGFTESDWMKYTFRQDEYEVHSQTQTIPVLYDEEYGIRKGKVSRFYPLFESEVKELNRKYKEIFGEGEIIRIEIVRLGSGKSVREHTDYGESLEKHHRTHIPIQTHPKCIFTVGGEEKHLKVGEIWEIDNGGKKHGVRNESDIDRIHLIVDWKPNEIRTII